MNLLTILLEKIDDFKSAIYNYNNFGLFFHGTSNPDLKKVVLPPIKTGSLSEKNRKKNLNKVFFTKNFKSAEIYSGRAFNEYGGVKRVVTVVPVGRIITLNQKHGTDVHMSDYAIVVQPDGDIIEQIKQFFLT